MVHCSKFARCVSLAIAIPMLAGCHILQELHHAPSGEQFLGAVRTGGPLASARTLPIPLEGLTLAEAVEQSIRPGLINNRQSVPAPTMSTLPVSPQELTTKEQVQSVVGLIRPRASAPGGNVDEAIELAVKEFTDRYGLPGPRAEEIKERLVDARDDQLFVGLTATPVPQEKFTQLYSDILEIINAPPPEINAATLTASPASATTDNIAVRLTRKAGNRIVIPLPMVRNYAAGDIWLADGDQIQVLPLTITEAGQQLPGLRSEPISALPIGEASGVNLLVLVRRSVVDGRLEEYLLPATNQGYYGNAGFVQSWQRSIYKLDTDEIKAGSLETNPTIRRSQINTIAASAAALDARANPVRDTMRQRLNRSLKRGTEAFGNLPVISQVRTQIEQQVGPITAPAALRPTASFDREVFCRSLSL